MKKEYTVATGSQTKWMDLDASDGRQEECTSVSGHKTTKMESGFFHSREVTSIRESLSMTSDKATGTTSGQTIESSRAGGTKTSNTDLESTLALNRQLRSLEYGRWANE